MKTLFDMQAYTSPWIVAHRGYSAKFPENTLAAFKAAMDCGVPMIELDVTLSRDRKLIVIHDDNLERTTDGHGSVSQYTLAELKQLDAGGWFHSRFSGERLPELTEVFDLVAGKIFINIEIKPEAYEAHHPPDAVEQQVAELVRWKNAFSSVLVSSFDINILQQLALLADPPALAVLSPHPADADMLATCRRLNAVSWHPDHRVLKPDQVEMMQAAGIHVMPYNAVTPKELARMFAMNVDGLFCDDPLMAERWKAHRKVDLPAGLQ